MKSTPNYYGIMPAKVRYAENLSASEKIMFVEISALSNINGYCHASNGYFAKLYDVTKQTVSGWVSSLKDGGYVKIETVESDNGNQRHIYPLMESINTPSGKDEPPIKEKLNHNNTSSNSTSDNINYVDYVEKWNEVNDANCRITDKKRSQIRQRLNVYSKYELFKAMESRSQDEWINGAGKKFKKDWNSFWRNDEKAETYLQRATLKEDRGSDTQSMFESL